MKNITSMCTEKVKSAYEPIGPIRPKFIPVSVAWSDWEYFYSMLVQRRVTPSIKFAGTYLYTWVERGTVRVKCLAQEHNTMSPGLESGPFALETRALPMRPRRLPQAQRTVQEYVPR